MFEWPWRVCGWAWLSAALLSACSGSPAATPTDAASGLDARDGAADSGATPCMATARSSQGLMLQTACSVAAYGPIGTLMLLRITDTDSVPRGQPSFTIALGKQMLQAGTYGSADFPAGKGNDVSVVLFDAQTLEYIYSSDGLPADGKLVLSRYVPTMQAQYAPDTHGTFDSTLPFVKSSPSEGNAPGTTTTLHVDF